MNIIKYSIYLRVASISKKCRRKGGYYLRAAITRAPTQGNMVCAYYNACAY